MLNTRSEQENTGFYSYLVCFVNTFDLNMYGFMSYTESTRRNTFFKFLAATFTGMREYVFNT